MNHITEAVHPHTDITLKTKLTTTLCCSHSPRKTAMVKKHSTVKLVPCISPLHNMLPVNVFISLLHILAVEANNKSSLVHFHLYITHITIFVMLCGKLLLKKEELSFEPRDKYKWDCLKLPEDTMCSVSSGQEVQPNQLHVFCDSTYCLNSASASSSSTIVLFLSFLGMREW